ncbi:hypothetical protein IAU60_004295 [Kwoniella sp. DSM 27419]
MSGVSGAAQRMEDKLEHTFTSGHPGTTGREPFEEPIGGGGQSTTAGTGADTRANLTGDHHTLGHGHGSGLPGDRHSHGNEFTSGQGQHGTGAGAVGVGSEVAGGQGLTGGEHHSHHHHHQSHGTGLENESRRAGEGVVGTGSFASGDDGHADYVRSHGGETDRPVGDDLNRGISGDRYAGDRTGNLNQGGAAYETTGTHGVATGGAANTDKFDTDRHHNTHGGLTGASATDRLEDNISRSTHNNSKEERHNIREAEREGNPSGGGLSSLTTTDDEFIGRDRKGGNLGAYADSEGPFKGNTSGPGGNTALTGREGTDSSRNPVAQAANDGKAIGTAPAGASSRPGVDEHAHEKKGLMEKVKDAVGL